MISGGSIRNNGLCVAMESMLVQRAGVLLKGDDGVGTQSRPCSCLMPRLPGAWALLCIGLE